MVAGRATLLPARADKQAQALTGAQCVDRAGWCVRFWAQRARAGRLGKDWWTGELQRAPQMVWVLGNLRGLRAEGQGGVCAFGRSGREQEGRARKGGCRSCKRRLTLAQAARRDSFSPSRRISWAPYVQRASAIPPLCLARPSSM